MPSQQEVIQALQNSGLGGDTMVPPPQSPADLRPLGAAVGIPEAVSALGNVGSNILSIPQRALESSESLRMGGDYDPGPVLQAATLGMGAAAPLAEEGAAGIFGGRLAQGANLAKLNKAQTIEAAGASPNETYLTTGWYRGTDGKWRFEIPDRKAEVTDYGDTLGQSLQHPDLYKQYPQLANRGVNWDTKTNSGFYSPTTGEINLSMYSDPRKQLPIALHEVQHAVQQVEGFAPGTNPQAMMAKATSLPELQGTPESDLLKGAREAYMRHAGEVESRNVEARQPMTNYERAVVPPWATEDRARGVQIVRPPMMPLEYYLKALANK